MKSLKKIATARLLVIILLLAVCMAGCAAPAEPNSGVPSETDAPAESDGSGAPEPSDSAGASVSEGTPLFGSAGAAQPAIHTASSSMITSNRAVAIFLRLFIA